MLCTSRSTRRPFNVARMAASTSNWFPLYNSQSRSAKLEIYEYSPAATVAGVCGRRSDVGVIGRIVEDNLKQSGKRSEIGLRLRRCTKDVSIQPYPKVANDAHPVEPVTG